MPLDNASLDTTTLDQTVQQAQGQPAPSPPKAAPSPGPFGNIAPDIPLAARQVIAAVAGPESSGRFNVLWTPPGAGQTQTFSDMSSHPKYQGWSGAPGPEGTSHAAGVLQWQPDTYDAGAAGAGLNRGQNGQYPMTPTDQLKVGAWQTADTYKKLTGGRDMIADWNAGYHQQVLDVLHSSGSPWAQKNPDTDLLLGWSNADKKQYQDGIADAHARAEEYRKIAEGASPGSVERAAALREARKALHSAEQQFQSLQKMHPTYTPLDPMQQFGSPAFMLALLGGLFAKQGFTAALGAAGAAMQARNQGNMDQYKIAMDQWKTESENALTNVKMANEDIKSILDDEKLSFDEKQAALTAKQAEWGMAHTTVEDAEKHNEARIRLAETAELAKQRIQMQQLMFQNKGYQPFQQPDPNDPTKTVTVFGIPGRPETFMLPDGTPIKPSPNIVKGATAAQQLPPELKYPDSWEGMPDKAPPGVRDDVWAATLSWIRDGKMPTMGMQAGQARNLIFQATPAAMHALNIKPTELADVRAQYAGERHAEVLLGGRTANLGLALNEAKQFIPMGDIASSNVDRTQYPSLNAVYEAALRGTGDVNVVRLVTATNAISNAYAQVAARGGQSTDAARAQAHDILNNAYSKGQYAEAADQMMREILAAQSAPVATQNDILKTFSDRWAPQGGARWFIGQVVETPKGKVVITGGDLNSDSPDVSPVEKQ